MKKENGFVLSQIRTNLLHPYLLLSLAVFFWAGNSVAGRAFSDELPPLAFVFWRWLLAALILFPLCIKPFLNDLPKIKKHWKYVSLQGLLSITIFNALLYWGLHFTTVVNTSLMQAAMPVMTLFFSWVLLKKGMALQGGIGIAISLFGVLWVILGGNISNLKTLSFNQGDLIILAAMIAWSIYTVLLARAPKEISRFGLTYAMVLSGLILMFPFFLIEYASGARFVLESETILVFLYVAIFPSVISFLCWNKGVEMVGANTAGVFLNLMPVYGTIMGVVLLSEAFQFFHIIGIIFIFAGIGLVTRQQKKS